MGLDQYLFKVSKVSAKEAAELNGLSYDDIQSRGFWIIPADECDELTEELKPFFTKIEASITYIDTEKIKKQFDVSDDYKCTGRAFGGGDYSWSYSSSVEGHESIRVKLTYEQIEKDFTYTVTKQSYVLRREEVAYWRKCYDLQDEMYNNFDVDNTKYVEIDTFSGISLIENYLDDDESPFDELEENEAIFYWEWY